MANKNKPLIYAKEWWVDDVICMRIPTIGEILDYGENAYFNTVYTLYATPYELMGQLDAMGIDFEKVSEFDMFCFAFLGMSEESAKMVFVNINPKEYKLAPDPDDKTKYGLINQSTGHIIRRDTAEKISAVLRKLQCTEKCTKKAGNSMMKKYLLDKARKAMSSAKRSKSNGVIEEMLVCLLNTSEFAAGSLNEALAMNIYFFNKSMRQINKKIDYDHVCSGIYAGTIDSKKINMKKIHWMNLE